MAGIYWSGAGAAVALGLLAGVAEHRRRNRRDADCVGLMPWPMIQFIALFAAFLLASLALHAS